MSFEEWSKFRKNSSYELRDCYEKLLGIPGEQRMKLTRGRSKCCFASPSFLFLRRCWSRND